MLRWSIATVCMGGALEAKLAAAAKAGFRAVELFENDLTFFSGKPREARSMAAISVSRSSRSSRCAISRRCRRRPAARNFERAQRKPELDADSAAAAVLCSNVSEKRSTPAHAAADLAELATARASMASIRLRGVAWGRHVRDWTAAWDIVRTADRPNLGIVLDSFTPA